MPSLVNKCVPAAGASRSAGTGSCKKSCRAGFSGAAALFCVERNEKEYDGCHIPLQFFRCSGLENDPLSIRLAYTQAQELMCAERVMDIQDSLPEIVFYEDYLPLCAYLSAYKKEELLRH